MRTTIIYMHVIDIINMVQYNVVPVSVVNISEFQKFNLGSILMARVAWTASCDSHYLFLKTTSLRLQFLWCLWTMQL